MWKKALMGTLAVVLIAAVAFSIYNVMGAQASTQATVAAGNGNRATTSNGQGAGAANQNANGARLDTPATVAGQNNQNGAGQGNGQAAQDANNSQQPGRGQQGGHQSQGQGQSMGQGQGQGQQGGQGAMGGAGMPNPQNGLGEWQTLEGTVSAFAAPNFTLTTADGQSIAVQLGNLSYVNELGLSLADGNNVSVVGAYESTGSLAVQSITVDGQTYTLRDETGRPLWAGRGSK